MTDSQLDPLEDVNTTTDDAYASDLYVKDDMVEPVTNHVEHEPTQVDTPHVATTATSQAVPAAPVDARTRSRNYRKQRFEARKVRRLIRHIDPWSVLKLAILVGFALWGILLIAAFIMWTVATNAGTVESIEGFVNSSLSLEGWQLDGEFLFRQFAIVSLIASMGFALALIVVVLIFNLISDLIGGIWVSVIEEETARPISKAPKS